MRIYLVGGAVRDSLLGLPVTERDYVVVGATPEQMLAQGFKPVGKDFPVFLHPQTQEEYALARTERKQSIGHKGFTFFTAPDLTLEDDLKRRDLTVNAIAQDNAGNLIDPYGGQHDLKQRVLRHVSEAFVEDPLRVLRVARFAARFHHLEFVIAPQTLTLMIAMQQELHSLSAQRIWMETSKVFAHHNPQVFFQVLIDVDALPQVMPTLADVFADPVVKQTCFTRLKMLEGQNPVFLFGAVSLAFTDVDNFQEFARAISTPKDYREFGELLIRCTPLLHAQSDAQNLLTLFDKADAWRRAQRFELFLLCAGHLWPELHDTCEHIGHTFSAANTVSTEEILASGVKGRAVGQALAQARLHIIAQFLLK